MRIYICDFIVLDRKGLQALWYESISLKTSIQKKGSWSKSYFANPINSSTDPLRFIEKYKHFIYLEGINRGIKFKSSYIDYSVIDWNEYIKVTDDYIEQETKALEEKLFKRDIDKYNLFMEKLVNGFPLNTNLFI